MTAQAAQLFLPFQGRRKKTILRPGSFDHISWNLRRPFHLSLLLFEGDCICNTNEMKCPTVLQNGGPEAILSIRSIGSLISGLVLFFIV